MSNIGAIGSSNMMMQSMGSRQRANPAEMAEKLFAQLDTSSQGYIEQSDLQQALGKIGNNDSSSAATLFSQLDGNSDGKVTKDEFASALQSVAEQLDSQFADMRMQGGRPPPPPPGNDAGFTKEELRATDSSSNNASLNASIVSNFDEADTDGDGKVSFKEAMAFEQASSGASNSTSGTSSSAPISASEDTNRKLMHQIMQLMQAYNLDSGIADMSSTVSVQA